MGVSYHSSSSRKLWLGVYIRYKPLEHLPFPQRLLLHYIEKLWEEGFHSLSYCLLPHIHFADENVCCPSPSSLGPQRCAVFCACLSISNTHLLYAIIMDKLSLVSYLTASVLQSWCSSYLLLQINYSSTLWFKTLIR